MLLGSIMSRFTSNSLNKPLEHVVLPMKGALTRRQRKCGSFQGKRANDWIVVLTPPLGEVCARKARAAQRSVRAASLSG